MTRLRIQAPAPMSVEVPRIVPADSPLSDGFSADRTRDVASLGLEVACNFVQPTQSTHLCHASGNQGLARAGSLRSQVRWCERQRGLCCSGSPAADSRMDWHYSYGRVARALCLQWIWRSVSLSLLNFLEDCEICRRPRVKADVGDAVCFRSFLLRLHRRLHCGLSKSHERGRAGPWPETKLDLCFANIFSLRLGHWICGNVGCECRDCHHDRAAAAFPARPP